MSIWTPNREINFSRLFIALHLLQLLHPGSSVNWLRSTYYLNKYWAPFCNECAWIRGCCWLRSAQGHVKSVHVVVPGSTNWYFTTTLLLPDAVTKFVFGNLLPCDQYGLCWYFIWTVVHLSYGLKRSLHVVVNWSRYGESNSDSQIGNLRFYR